MKYKISHNMQRGGFLKINNFPNTSKTYKKKSQNVDNFNLKPGDPPGF